MEDTDFTSFSNRLRILGRKFKAKRKRADRKQGERKHMDRNFSDGLNCIDDDITTLAGVEDRSEFFLSGVSLNDHYISKIVNERTRLKKSTITFRESFISDHRSWTKFSRETYKDLQLIEFSSDAGMIIDNMSNCFIDYSVNSNAVDVKVYGDEQFVKFHQNILHKNFNTSKSNIEWMYSGDGSSVSIPLSSEKLPVTEMYPFLEDETVEEYYDRYMNSSASILLLIGPPGTGKTTFIRGLLHYTGKNALVTYDEKLLEKDYVFARFLEDDANFMIIEDADNFIISRKEGNTMMHRFLNVGDGLVGVKGKKLIFSTNLPSIDDIDSALIRPGRCFDILHFDNYSEEQAKNISKKLNIELVKKDNGTYSLAEVFHNEIKAPKNTKKMGFY
jgi:hypothetical protein